MIAARLASDTPGRSFRAYETATLDTPARRAMSAIVGRFTGHPSVRRRVNRLATRAPEPYYRAARMARPGSSAGGGSIEEGS
ncbi:hypothetical protein GCM10010149_70700 [Nonomuraea roseoviolacea subsp. roseoviolacea]